MTMAKPAPEVETPKVAPAPHVEPATAAAARPRSAPVVDVAPLVETAVADPPPTDDDGPSRRSQAVATTNHNSTTTSSLLTLREEERPKSTSLSIENLRSTHTILFESLAAVIIGPAQKDLCQKLCPCLGERSYISYGEIQRHVLLTNGNTLFVYADSTDPSPLYTISLVGLKPEIEDAHHRDVNSTTISPGTEGTNMRMYELETVLLYDSNGKIQYQFAFDSKNASEIDVSERFIAAIQSSSHLDTKVASCMK